MTETPEHLTPHMTNRGFMHMPPTQSTYQDSVIRVYESSAALGPHIWVTGEEPGPNGKVVAVHLTLEDAVKVAEQILFVAKNHYQVRGFGTEFELPETALETPS